MEVMAAMEVMVEIVEAVGVTVVMEGMAQALVMVGMVEMQVEEVVMEVEVGEAEKMEAETDKME